MQERAPRSTAQKVSLALLIVLLLGQALVVLATIVVAGLGGASAGQAAILLGGVGAASVLLLVLLAGAISGASQPAGSGELTAQRGSIRFWVGVESGPGESGGTSVGGSVSADQ
jgi:hypothetical protein